MSEKNAKLLRKYHKYINEFTPQSRVRMIDDLIKAGHLTKIQARRKRAR